ncbi:MAG: 50S ribosomal protein L9 [Firmicutes bacterium]|nr:50S ribosomal protein L9 [Bacillota bacterium]
MKIILKEDIPGLGEKGEVKDVAPGYGRNLLIPRGLAVEATPGRLRELQQQEQVLERKRERLKEESLVLAERLEQMEIRFRMAAGEGGRLFGSVTAADIAAELHKLGFSVEKKKVILEEPIKAAGRYEITVKLHSGVKAAVAVEVEAED